MKKYCPKCDEPLKVSEHDPAQGQCNACGWRGRFAVAVKDAKLPAVPPKLSYVSIDIETTGLNPDTCQTLEVGAVLDDWTRPIDQLPTFRRVLAWDEVKGSPYAMALNANLLKLIGNRPRDPQQKSQDALDRWIEKCGLEKSRKDFPCDAVLKLLEEEPIAWHEIPNFLLSTASKYIPEVLQWGGNPPGTSCFCYEYEIAPLFADWLKAHGFNPKSVQAAGKNFAAFDMQFLNRLPQFSSWVVFGHRVLDPAILYWKQEDEKLPDSKTCSERAGNKKKVAHTAVEDATDVVVQIRQGIKRLWQ